MEDYLGNEYSSELVIHTNIQRFEQWLRQFRPNSIPDAIERDGTSIFVGIPTVVFEDKFIKYLGSPYLEKDLNGLKFYYIRISVGSIDSVLEDVKSSLTLPLLKIFETTEGKITVSLRMSNIDIYSYIKDLTKEIAQVWPETKRQVFSMELYDSLRLNNVIFEYIIEAEPKEFMVWCHNELNDLYPGVFSVERFDQQFLSYVNGDIFPPDEDNPFWDYFIFSKDIEFSENVDTEKVEPSEDFSGIIATIELRHINNHRYKVKCVCGSDHPQILGWLIAFERILVSVYVPIQPIKKKNLEILSRGRLTGVRLAEMEKRINQFVDQAKWQVTKVIPDRDFTIFFLAQDIYIPFDIGQVRVTQSITNQIEWEIFSESSEENEKLVQLSETIVALNRDAESIHKYSDIQEKPVWEKIPDHLWDRLAIQMWCNGHTNVEIGRKVGVSPRAVTNKISELRRRNPDAGIPTEEQRRRKLMIRDDTG